jgi:hypothetical protein
VTSTRERVLTLVRAARRLADPGDPLGARARRELPGSTRLSPEGVAYALERCLESEPSEAEIGRLCSAATAAPRAHVLLSANVFVAAHRAVALALAASEHVCVRPSRREPAFVELLAEAAPGSFTIVSELRPEPGDHVFAYGSDETLGALRASLPRGVVLHAHGAGFGIALLGRHELSAELALDVAAFDQRGCLSPRLVLVPGEAAKVRETARAIAAALADIERDIPLGELTAAERADVARYRDSMAYAAELLPAGRGFVSAEAGAEMPLIVPPVGRNLHVAAADRLEERLAPMAGHIAAVGLDAAGDFSPLLAAIVPRARRSALGRMQRPSFDGPVDLRMDPGGEIL